MSITLRIFVYHTSHGFAVFTIQTWFTGCRPNVCHSVFAIQTDVAFGSIFADSNVITKTDFQCPVFYRRRNTIGSFDLYSIIQCRRHCLVIIIG